MDWSTTVTVYAATAQAGASVIALGVATAAVVVPWRQQKHREQIQKRELSLKRECLAHAMIFDLGQILVSILTEKIIPIDDSFFLSNTAAKSTARKILASRVVLPPTLVGATDQIYLFGDHAGPIVLQMLLALKVHNDTVEREASRCISEPDISLANQWRFISGVIDHTKTMITNAIDALAPIMDGVG